MSWKNLYPFESQWFETESGARMHYIDEGPKDAPVLFMMHGNPTWSFYYRDLVKKYSTTFRCVVPDHIGCGLSDKPQDYDYNLATRVRDVQGLANELGLNDITMVVHDWGGAIGMGFACAEADRVKRFVVFNTAAFLSDVIPFSIAMCRWPLFGPIAVRGFNGFVRAAQFRAIYDRANLAGDVGDGYVAPYDNWANRVAIHKFVEDIPMKPTHPSYDTLRDIDHGISQFSDHPMLIVWGDDDFCFTPEFREEWETRFPDAEVHAFRDAGHFVLEEKTDEIIGWMDTFLDVA